MFFVDRTGTYIFIEDAAPLMIEKIIMRYKNKRGKLVEKTVKFDHFEFGLLISLPGDYEKGLIEINNAQATGDILGTVDVTPNADFSHDELKKYKIK